MSAEAVERTVFRRLRGAITERRGRVGSRKGVPVFSVTNRNGIQAADRTFSKQVHSHDIVNYKILEPGWYAYNPSRVDVGSIARNNLGVTGCISPFYTVFSLDDPSIDPEIFRHFVFSHRFKQRVNANLQGSVRDILTFDALESFLAYFPDYPEQVAIAELLQSVEDNISQSRILTKSLSAAKYGVMRDLLTRGVRRDVAPLQPLPERWVLGRVAGDVSQIPADWKLVRLTSVARLESGHTPDRKEPDYWNGDIPWISLQDATALGKLTISETAETIGEQGLANSSARLLPARTVVFQRTANVGLCSVMEREMCTSQHFANWVCGPKLWPEYLQQVFRHMQREWQRLVAGSVLPDIYMPTFKRLQILLPPLPEQKRIAEVGASFDLRIEAEQRKLEELTNVRAALAQELLSGRLRLPASMVARFSNRQASIEVANA